MKSNVWKNNYGEEITFEQLEQISDEVSSGDFSNFEVIEVGYGKVKRPVVEKSSMTVMLPKPLKVQIQKNAEANKCSVSDYVRSILTDEVMNRAAS